VFKPAQNFAYEAKNHIRRPVSCVVGLFPFQEVVYKGDHRNAMYQFPTIPDIANLVSWFIASLSNPGHNSVPTPLWLLCLFAGVTCHPVL
jgi:hypothetical protein